MKTLSIRQPYADLILRGLKDVENRTWTTDYRGPLLIHAGKTLEDGPLVRRFYGPDHDWDLGGIVGVVDLVDVVTDSASPWAGGKYQWLLKHPRRVDFYPLKGKLNLFEVDWPPTDSRPAAPKRRDERLPDPPVPHVPKPGEAVHILLPRQPLALIEAV